VRHEVASITAKPAHAGLHPLFHHAWADDDFQRQARFARHRAMCPMLTDLRTIFLIIQALGEGCAVSTVSRSLTFNSMLLLVNFLKFCASIVTA
jgi:hypothetical protein